MLIMRKLYLVERLSFGFAYNHLLI